MRKTVNIMGVPVDNVTMAEAVDRVKLFLDEDSVHTVFTPNAEIMMEAQRDREFKGVLKAADMVIADGAGVVLASKILGTPVPERVPGYDLTRGTFTIDRNIKYFFFGCKPGVAQAAAEKVLGAYTGIEVVGCRDGYFSKDDESNIIEQINLSGADILLVALGAPKQEKWIDKHKDKLRVKVCIGVGGSLDVLAGTAKRAPEFYQKHNIEWLYRLCKEPNRFLRMLDLPRYVILAFAVKLGLRRN
jgi:N-acetylglucosaminyldiphosphoundecaprenol N-acetyl-beta-D-mannosaminyltransferase